MEAKYELLMDIMRTTVDRINPDTVKCIYSRNGHSVSIEAKYKNSSDLTLIIQLSRMNSHLRIETIFSTPTADEPVALETECVKQIIQWAELNM